MNHFRLYLLPADAYVLLRTKNISDNLFIFSDARSLISSDYTGKEGGVVKQHN